MYDFNEKKFGVAGFHDRAETKFYDPEQL